MSRIVPDKREIFGKWPVEKVSFRKDDFSGAIQFDGAIGRFFWRELGSVLIAVSKIHQTVLELCFGKPVAIDHNPGPFGHVFYVLERVRFEKQKIGTPARSHYSELAFLVQEYRGVRCASADSLVRREAGADKTLKFLMQRKAREDGRFKRIRPE